MEAQFLRDFCLGYAQPEKDQAQHPVFQGLQMVLKNSVREVIIVPLAGLTLVAVAVFAMRMATFTPV